MAPTLSPDRGRSLRHAGRAASSILSPVLAYLGVVAGGVTLFLAIAPLFGYLGYSDRPGPGWFGRFPALTAAQFLENAADAISTGAFFAILFIIPGALLAALVASLRRGGLAARRMCVLGGGAGLLLTGWWMAGAGWYIAAGTPLLVWGALLGALAGGWTLPRAGPRLRRALAAVPLLLLCAIPVEIARDMGPRPRATVYLRAGATHEQVREVWRIGMDDRAVSSGGRDMPAGGGEVVSFWFRPRTSLAKLEAMRGRLMAEGAVDSVVLGPPR